MLMLMPMKKQTVIPSVLLWLSVALSSLVAVRAETAPGEQQSNSGEYKQLTFGISASIRSTKNVLELRQDTSLSDRFVSGFCCFASIVFSINAINRQRLFGRVHASLHGQLLDDRYLI